MKFANINIGKRLVITFGAITSLTLALAFASYQTLSNLSGRWEQFRTVTLEKTDAASIGEQNLGTGIHHFKNYLLRGQDYDQKFMADMDAIDQAAARYVNNHGDINEREKSALSRIKEGAESYRAALKKAVEMKTSGASIEEIDKAIKGADKVINMAFDELLAVTREQAVADGQMIASTVADGVKVIIVIGVLAVVMGVLFAWLTSISITHPLQKAVMAVSAVAKGDLTQHIEVTSTDETGQLLQALQGLNKGLTAIVADVHHSADTITSAAQEIAAGNSDLSHRTEGQASSLEQTAASMEDLTVTVRQNAENAKQASQLAASASDIAVKGGQVVDEVVGTMASISTSSKKIVDIIGVIEGIAFQTNILALNAAVEAARAGEQGRGFAVVAGEVRNLAQRSAAAAKEIKALIDDSVDKVDTGSIQVDRAGATMNEIVTAVKRVTDIMAEIAAASNEQSAGIDQVNQAIAQMDEVTQRNAALVEEAAAASESMQEQADTLMGAVSVFKLNTGGGGARATVINPAVRTVAKPAFLRHPPAAVPPRKNRSLIKAGGDKDGDWKEF